MICVTVTQVDKARYHPTYVVQLLTIARSARREVWKLVPPDSSMWEGLRRRVPDPHALRWPPGSNSYSWAEMAARKTAEALGVPFFPEVRSGLEVTNTQLLTMIGQAEL